MSGIFSCPSMHIMRHTEADADGMGVCLDCGAPVSCGVLTEAGLDDMVNAILRAPHTRRCVQLDDGWACPPECPTRPARPV